METRPLSQSARNRKILESGTGRAGISGLKGFTGGRKSLFKTPKSGIIKYKPLSSKQDISGPTQTAGIHPTVTTKAKAIDPVRFLTDRGWKITSFGAISAGSALSTKKKKQKKRVGRTILTSN